HLLLFCCLLRQLHQLFRHPLAEALLERRLDADGAVVPLVGAARSAALALVLKRLVEAEGDAVDDLAPVLLLYAAAYEREASAPVLFGSARVLLRDGQVLERRHRRAFELVVEATPQLLERHTFVLAHERHRAAE